MGAPHNNFQLARGVNNRQSLLTWLPATRDELIEKTGFSRASVNRHLKTLVEEGAVYVWRFSRPLQPSGAFYTGPAHPIYRKGPAPENYTPPKVKQMRSEHILKRRRKEEKVTSVGDFFSKCLR